MMHIGGSDTMECRDCGSRLIEGLVCLTCDSMNVGEIRQCLEKDCTNEPEITVTIKEGRLEREFSLCFDHVSLFNKVAHPIYPKGWSRA
jgi:hypothetical protein